jgi:hypothetical protein
MSLREFLKKRFPVLRRTVLYIRSFKERREATKALAAIENFPTVHERRPSGLPGELIISLTSYPRRYPLLTLTLKSLIDQTVKADKLILWIADNDFKSLPEEIWQLTSKGLEIQRCHDLKSANKLVHALRIYPDAFIVTADDDLYYPPNWLETLIRSYDALDPAVVGTRAHIARYGKDGYALPYATWKYDTDRTVIDSQQEALFLTGVGGILYPPRCMHEEVLNEGALMRLCPRADDIWFFGMQELSGVKRRRTLRKFPVVSWPSSQDTGLLHSNIDGGGNDRQMRALQDAYPKLKKHRPA